MTESAKRTEGGAENRRFHRSTVLWPATLSCAGADIDCVIFNISANGAKIRVKTGFVEGTEVTLCSARFGTIPGEIVWSGPTSLGIRFTAPPQDVARAMGDRLPLIGGDLD